MEDTERDVAAVSFDELIDELKRLGLPLADLLPPWEDEPVEEHPGAFMCRAYHNAGGDPDDVGAIILSRAALHTLEATPTSREDKDEAARLLSELRESGTARIEEVGVESSVELIDKLCGDCPTRGECYPANH